MSYRSEFSRIEETSFWQDYSKRIEESRDGLLMNLSKGKIDEPATLGRAWQEALRIVEQIMRLPEKMIAE